MRNIARCDVVELRIVRATPEEGPTGVQVDEGSLKFSMELISISARSVFVQKEENIDLAGDETGNERRVAR